MDSSAVRIQCIARVWLARQIASQKRVELTLSSRLLHLLKKLRHDGNLHSMLSEINADYRHYDRELKEIEVREDETASTFIGKVFKERRREYDEAWREYHAASDCGGLDRNDCGGLDRNDESTPDRLRMYNPVPRKSPPNTSLPPFVDSSLNQNFSTKWEFDRMEELDLAGLSHTASHQFSGTSILYDIPQLLDDTLARLFNAVAIRSMVPLSLSKRTEAEPRADAFDCYLNLPPGLEKASIEAEAKSQAKPVIEQFKQMGFVYISDAMPRTNLLSLLESQAIITLPSPPFISHCNDVLTYLEKAHAVNTSTKGSLRSLVSEFIESRQGIVNVEREVPTAKGASEKRAVEFYGPKDDDSLPSGLFDEASSERDPNTLQCNLLATDEVDTSHHDLSAPNLPVMKKHNMTLKRSWTESFLLPLPILSIGSVQANQEMIRRGLVTNLAQPIDPTQHTAAAINNIEISRWDYFAKQGARKRCDPNGLFKTLNQNQVDAGLYHIQKQCANRTQSMSNIEQIKNYWKILIMSGSKRMMPRGIY